MKSHVFQTDIAKKIAKILIETQSVKIQPKSHPFTWSSGMKSPIYCNNRKLLSFTNERNYIVENFIDMIESTIVDMGFNRNDFQLAGVATAGIPWGAIMADRMSMPFTYIRPQPKDHGLNTQLEGVLHHDKQVFLIEDLFSTGNSTVKAGVVAQNIIGKEKVTKAGSIFEYNFQETENNFKNREMSFQSLCDFETLLPIAVEMNQITEDQLIEVQSFANDPRGWLPKKYVEF